MRYATGFSGKWDLSRAVYAAQSLQKEVAETGMTQALQADIEYITDKLMIFCVELGVIIPIDRKKDPEMRKKVWDKALTLTDEQIEVEMYN